MYANSSSSQASEALEPDPGEEDTATGASAVPKREAQEGLEFKVKGLGF